MALLSEVFKIREGLDQYYENKKVARVIESCNDFSESDFLDLAMACLDQSGMGSADQSKIEKMIAADRAKIGK